MPELGGRHDGLAVFRTVENGFSLFRPDNDAVSVATDYPGRPVAAGDYSPTEDPIIVVNLPTRRANTFYTLIGDLFAWAAIAGFVTLSILSIRRKTSYYHK